MPITAADILQGRESYLLKLQENDASSLVRTKKSLSQDSTEGTSIDAIEYIQASWGLNWEPRPWQIFALKLAFGIKLDDRDHDHVLEIIDRRTIRVARARQFYSGAVVQIGEERALVAQKIPRDNIIVFSRPLKNIDVGMGIRFRLVAYDRFKTRIIGTFNEEGFLEFLYGKGPNDPEHRCNFTPDRHKARIGRSVNLFQLRMGRRSGKTILCQMIAGFMTYEVIRKSNPQEYYGINQDQPIQLTLMSVSAPRAQKLLRPIRSAIRRSATFRDYIHGKGSTTDLVLHTRYTREHRLSPDSGVTISASPCTSRARGDANLMVLLEEYGLFRSAARNKGSATSDAEIFRALNPSTIDFVDSKTGHACGMTAIVSTPVSMNTHMYELEEKTIRGELENSLFLWLPNVWCNPNLTEARLREDWAKDKLSHLQENEARWLHETTSGFTKDNLEACRITPEPTSLVLRPGEACYMGLDVGLKQDGTSIFIVAGNPMGLGRIVYEQNIIIGADDRSTWEPYMDDMTRENLDIRKIAARIDSLWTQWGVVQGLGDQYNSYGIRAFLRSSARRLLELVEMTQAENDRIARNFIHKISQRQVEFYYKPDVWEDPNSTFKEIVTLERTNVGNKIKLHAPKGHDDRYSALSRALWLIERGQESRPTVENSVTPPMARLAENVRAQKEARIRQMRGQQTNVRNPKR